jgi:two-component system sensor histidine kinase VicK
METGNQNLPREMEFTEIMLKKENARLWDSLENAAVPLHWVNGSGIVIWVNKAELDLLGYSREEFVNQHISKFHADKEVLEDILLRLINKETLINYPARLICKSGELRHVLINSNVYWEDDKFIHTRCFTRDITKLKAIETERESLIKNLQDQVEELQRGIVKQDKELRQ